jgi:hypothetical protein
MSRSPTKSSKLAKKDPLVQLENRFFRGLNYDAIVAEHGEKSQKAKNYLQRNPTAQRDRRFAHSVLRRVLKAYYYKL